MAASRAIKELIQLNIISELDSGKFKRYEFNFSRRSLWIKHKHQIAKLATDFIPVPKSKINSLDVFYPVKQLLLTIQCYHRLMLSMLLYA